MPRLDRLDLTDFRNYAALTWRPQSRLVVLTGPNGSGKTNLLEAISLLAPGRGLRGARIGELARHGGSGRWAVAAQLTTSTTTTRIGTGTLGDGAADRRVFRLDGEEPRHQAEIASHFAAIWLTPQMDMLFQEAASGRRRFLDRLVTALEPAHAREAAAHDTAMAGRNKLLATPHPDAAWLAGLEESMARHAVALAAARRALLARLNETPSALGDFPAAHITLLDPVADRLASTPALAVETWLRCELATRRAADAAAGSATLGAHRADMNLADAASGLPAALASTGQRKALLIGVILAHALLIAETRGTAPLLLLDEPCVHLDETRREALLAALAALPAQTLLTGTDPAPFTAWRQTAEFLQPAHGALRADG